MELLQVLKLIFLNKIFFMLLVICVIPKLQL